MPSDQPNENMDKVLKAYAKKRREDSTQMEMDIPTRNMLQAEVKRTLAEVPVPAVTKPRPRFAWWPQLIIGVASAAALAIAVLVWKLPSRTETSDSTGIARNETVVSAPTADAASIAPKEKPESTVITEVNSAAAFKDQVQTPVPVLAGETKTRDGFAQQVSQDHLKAKKQDEPLTTWSAANNASTDAAVLSSSSPMVTLTTPPPTSTALVITNGIEMTSKAYTLNGGSLAESAPIASVAPTPVLKSESATALSPTPAASVAAPVTAPQITTRSMAKAEASNLDRLQKVLPPQKQRIEFSQVSNYGQYRVNLNSPPLPKVLTKFRFERTGTNVLIKDADGSVYAGKAFQNAVSQNHTQAFVGGGVANSANSPALNAGDAIPDDNFAFRVSGYNNKLRQKIIFNGNVINAAQNALSSNVVSLYDQSGALQNQSNNTQQLLRAQNVLLNGRVQVGRNSEFNIQAAPITK